MIGVVRCIILFGTDVDSIENDKTTLMVAAGCGASQASQALLRLKAQINYVDRDGATALAIACANGHEDIALQILARFEPLDNYDDPTNVALFGSSEARAQAEMATDTNPRSDQHRRSKHHHPYGQVDCDKENGRGLAVVDARIPFIRRGRGTTALHLACRGGLVRAAVSIVGHAKRQLTICVAREKACRNALDQFASVLEGLHARQDALEDERAVLEGRQPKEEGCFNKDHGNKNTSPKHHKELQPGSSGLISDSEESDDEEARQEADRLRRLAQNRQRTSSRKWEERIARDAALATELARQKSARDAARLASILAELSTLSQDIAKQRQIVGKEKCALERCFQVFIGMC